MNVRRMTAGLAVILAAVLASTLEAIVIRHDRDDADHRALGARFPAVGKVLPDGEGTLIAPRWVVTAAHVGRGVRRVGGSVRFADREYAVGGVYLHPDWRGQESDIALIKLQEAVTGIEPAAIYRGRDERGQLVTFVGRGDFGTGEAGVLRQDGVLRGATNRVERVTDDWVIFTFDPPEQASRLEGISGPGDSGGPALVEDRGASYVLGISSGGESPPGGAPGMYGSREYYARVSSYAGWIDEVLSGAVAAGPAVLHADDERGQEALARGHADAFLAAYRAGEDADLEAFFAAHMSSGGDRPPTAERVAGIQRLRERWGDLEVLEITVSPGRVDVQVAAAARGGARILLGFELEPAAPYLIDAILADMLDGPGGRAASVPPPDASIRTPFTPEKMARVASDYMEMLEEDHAFSGVVLLARDGEAFFEGAYGLASRRFGAPNDAGTRFNVGSITKGFTKVAIGQLHRDGKLSFDDTILDHLPDYPNREVAGRITIRHLLEHTSGLGDIFNEKFQATPKERMRDPGDFFFLFADAPLRFEPGEEMEYSNAGYIVLGAIVEAASEMPYRQYIRENVFGPAGMEASGFFAQDDPVPNVAEGYTRRGCPDGDGEPCRSNRFLMNFEGCPAGGSYATAMDLLRFDQALRGDRLLPPAYTRWFFTGTLSDEGTSPDPAGRMAGWAGGGPGVSASVESGDGMTVVVLANIDPPITEEIARHLSRLMRRMSG